MTYSSTPLSKDSTLRLEKKEDKSKPSSFKKLMEEDDDPIELPLEVPSPFRPNFDQTSNLQVDHTIRSLEEITPFIDSLLQHTKDNGIDTTNLMIRMEGELGLQQEWTFTIKEFDTAPKTLQIECGFTQGVSEQLKIHLQQLLFQLQRNLPHHQIQFLAPQLPASMFQDLRGFSLVKQETVTKDLFKREKVLYRVEKDNDYEEPDLQT